jgi:hypothetical protein
LGFIKEFGGKTWYSTAVSGVKDIILQSSSRHIHGYFVGIGISVVSYRIVSGLVFHQSRNLLVGHGGNHRVNLILAFANSTVRLPRNMSPSGIPALVQSRVIIRGYRLLNRSDMS